MVHEWKSAELLPTAHTTHRSASSNMLIMGAEAGAPLMRVPLATPAMPSANKREAHRRMFRMAEDDRAPAESASSRNFSDVALGRLAESARALNVKFDLRVGDATQYKFRMWFSSGIVVPHDSAPICRPLPLIVSQLRERNVGTGRPLDKGTQYGIRQFLLVAATKSIGLYKNSYIRHNLNY